MSLCSQAVRLRKSSHTVFHRWGNFSPLVGIGKGSWTASQHQGPDARPQSAALSTTLMIGPMDLGNTAFLKQKKKKQAPPLTTGDNCEVF